MSERVIVVGGGLAGLAAAYRLSQTERQVTLFEARPQAGGRFTSYQVSGFSNPLDNSPHIIAGSFRESLQFFNELGSRRLLRRCREINVLNSNGKFEAVRPLSLPPPLHLLSYLYRWSSNWNSFLQAGWGLFRLLRLPTDSYLTVDQWLKEHQPANLAANFWHQFIGSVFNASPQHISYDLFARWLRQVFLLHSRSGDFYLPRVPLEHIIRLITDKIKESGAVIRTGCRVKELVPSRRGVVTAAGERINADRLVVALPPRHLIRLLPPQLLTEQPFCRLANFGETESIISLHFEFNYPVNLPVLCYLKEEKYDWLINTPGEGRERNIQFLRSVARSELNCSDSELVSAGCRILEQIPGLDLEKNSIAASQVLKNRHSTVTLSPAACGARFGPKTPCRGFYLAGAWTTVNWPITVEAAVRSGFAAACAISNST